MKIKLLIIIVSLANCLSAFTQNKTYNSPDERFRALIIPIGEKGYENYESRVEILTSRGRLLRLRSFASSDHNHGEGVSHAEWSGDGQFFVFNTFSSGGHQPWHVTTYFYSRRSNRFYSLDGFIGSITSDFKLEGRNTVVTTRFNFKKNDDKERVKVNLQNLRVS